MKKLLIIILLIPTLFIKIPEYVELNNLIIIDTIIVKEDKNHIKLYLKEIIPTKSNQGITYKYKYYHEEGSNIKNIIKKIKLNTNKKLYLKKTKKLITNKKNTDIIKKELDIKPNSIIHTNNIENYIKDYKVSL